MLGKQAEKRIEFPQVGVKPSWPVELSLLPAFAIYSA